MFRLEHPDYLWWLLLLPLLVLAYSFYWRSRQQALLAFAEKALLDRLVPGLNQRLPWTKFLLLFAAIPLLALAYTNPQWSSQREEIKRRGIDLIIALDVSRSMLAEDVQPSRMDRANYFASTLVDALTGNNIGVELFTCTAILQAPLTTDYSFVKSVISTAGPYQIGSQGTNIGEAIAVAEKSFKAENKNHRALVIISDGEDHDGDASRAAAAAHEKGLLIYTVGVGKTQGSYMPIILDNGARDYVRNSSGKPAQSSADMNSLAAIAETGGGRFYPLSSDAEALASAIRQQIEKIEKLEFESQSFTSYESYFYYFLWPAFGLLLLEFLIGLRNKSHEQL